MADVDPVSQNITAETIAAALTSRTNVQGAYDFAANSLIFKCALDYYLAEGFTLIELGDAE